MVKVLFVCVGNTCRSQLAEAFARRLGAGVLDVHSAGTAPKEAVDPRAAAVLEERGYDVAEATPKSVDAVPPGPYEWMIRMGCGDVLLVPALHREDWDYPAPSQLSDVGFEALCLDLEDRVRNLVARAKAWADATGFPLDTGDHASVDTSSLALTLPAKPSPSHDAEASRLPE
ncbi:MAG: arsenate reductase ArsC [Bacteroidota bacterium]